MGSVKVVWIRCGGEIERPTRKKARCMRNRIQDGRDAVEEMRGWRAQEEKKAKQEVEQSHGGCLSFIVSAVRQAPPSQANTNPETKRRLPFLCLYNGHRFVMDEAAVVDRSARQARP